jgi:hypothetical protein
LDALAIGKLNIVFGWVWMNMGFITGLLMGLKAEQFGLNTQREGPTWLDGYGSVPRRLIRLGHVAFIMLPVLNILYGQFIDGANLPHAWKVAGSTSMIVGAVGVPLLCMGAAFYRPLKIFLGLPASAVLLGNLIIAAGYALR